MLSKIISGYQTGASEADREKNVLISDGTEIFSHGQLTGGSGLTRKLAVKHGKPWLHTEFTVHDIEAAVALPPVSSMKMPLPSSMSPGREHPAILNIRCRLSGDSGDYRPYVYSGRISNFEIQPKLMLASGHLLFPGVSMCCPRYL